MSFPRYPKYKDSGVAGAPAKDCQLVLFTSDDGDVSVSAKLVQETIWLTQEQISNVFEVNRPGITKHLKSIFSTGELNEATTCSILEHMGQNDSRAYSTKHYSLDAIIAVGYRVNSKIAESSPFERETLINLVMTFLTESDR